MAVKSYLVHAEQHHFSSLVEALDRRPECDVYPAEQGGMAILVTETSSDEGEQALESFLRGLSGIQCLTLVFGHSGIAV